MAASIVVKWVLGLLISLRIFLTFILSKIIEKEDAQIWIWEIMSLWHDYICEITYVILATNYAKIVSYAMPRSEHSKF